jgi:hypothetical protein
MTRARTVSALNSSVQREQALAFQRKCCAASTCGERVNPGRIFCANHWFFLPLWLRRAIINTFRDAEWDLHREAIRQGVDAIDDAHMTAVENGFSGVVSAKSFENERSRGKQVRFAGRAIA